MTHGMPKQGVAKEAWQADCLSPGMAMHCSRHAKTKGGQGMASKLLGAGCLVVGAKANFATIGGVVSLPWGSHGHPTPSAMARCYRDPSGNSWPWLLVETRPVGNAQKKTKMPLKRNAIVSRPARQSTAQSGKARLYRAILGCLASDSPGITSRR
ncbi:hypothetical protein RHGRI_011422 [Rhododendron griersonianum]|uniref:Uncharacterized protein n=1 Tax=Rhododendron griersonianum TaxID=479676 RepID=A0AAV6KN75_9ERIC|nr:hypothetical protein RHGRI_011422 [Rhododendron griersonianum]